MLTNTLLLYMTQEALAKARARLIPRKDETSADHARHMAPVQPAWQLARRQAAKLRAPLRH
ncbi:MAG: hypothetical protein OJJ21_09570 [Ferrovibrio sp.]|uniref:hypothetical protein n=1 Tax=Ferrovibrio sp. TaxID=1917215 RepID=UPI002613C9F6|nr:hypothetical protein [Ferrovibrio sp.]MCW0233833.1 hypothetical protein [Ferrovibrio sp.]